MKYEKLLVSQKEVKQYSCVGEDIGQLLTTIMAQQRLYCFSYCIPDERYLVSQLRMILLAGITVILQMN